ncbi:MAG: C4-type zinc ribbon domain-containing protein [Dehalococcoidia bacterium]
MNRLHQDLSALQSIDDELARLRRQLDDVLARFDEPDGIASARQELAQAEARRDALRRRQRALEADVLALNDRVHAEEQRLYSGSVKLPRELESLQQEVAALRRQRSRVEDDLLEVMNELEEVEPACDEAARHLATLESDHTARTADLSAERDRLQAAIDRDEARRKQVAGTIPPGVLALYDDLARRKAGAAVAHLRGTTCSRCRVSMPDTVRRHIITSDGLTQCPNCERLLVLG